MNLPGPGPANRPRRQSLFQFRGRGLQAGHEVSRRKDGDKKTFRFRFRHKQSCLLPLSFADDNG
jgi:hypothetical protein